jgi:peptidyl-prolyl cis-trans isomerase B (cyclophilin B)
MSQVKLTTSLGEIEIGLDNHATPETVTNFLEYVRSGHYDGTIFHRVIDGFMIQGGGMLESLEQKPTKAPIKNEGKRSSEAGLKNATYTIAMARTNDPHSATAQFFINTTNNDFLNFQSETSQGYGYCVFGRVTQGQNIVDQIGKVKTGSKNGFRDVPVQPVVIEKAEEITPTQAG